MKIPIIVTSALLTLASGLAKSAVTYTVTDLRSGGGTVSTAQDIHNSGQVVGTTYTPPGVQHAFRYSGHN